jgi:hypothetical protein
MITAAILVTVGLAQQPQPVPQPFPRPGSQRPAQPPATTPPPQQPPPQPATSARTTTAAGGEEAPTQATLGLPVYPAAIFLRSFDAGQGQRYYLFGTNATFVEIVAYYRTYLKNRGNEVFENDPPTHIFEVGRFREETMAYAPGITVKDYNWNGSEGYLHVRPGQPPQRYRTIIQIVPVPAGAR